MYLALNTINLNFLLTRKTRVYENQILYFEGFVRLHSGIMFLPCPYFHTAEAVTVAFSVQLTREYYGSYGFMVFMVFMVYIMKQEIHIHTSENVNIMIACYFQ